MREIGSERPTLALSHVSKSFGAVRALRDVSLELFAGEAHALAGENGAGKSTLVKTLAGVHRPDSGQVLLDGEPVTFAGPADAQQAGVAVIYQEPTLFPDLSVAENIFMGRQPRARSRAASTARPCTREAAELFERLGVTLDPEQPARGLSIADQQLVEIAKALSRDARVLIMDEPTAALSGNEVARLFSVVEALREQGCAVLFISHRLDEIFALCQRVTTLRDGAWIASEPRRRASPTTTWSAAWSAATSTPLYPKQETTAGEVALQVERLTREGVFTDVSFQVRRGEIVALAGLVGAGRSEVARASSASTGGTRARSRWPAAAARRQPHRRDGAPGWPWCPEDRRQQGLVMELSIERNIGLTGLRSLRRGPVDLQGRRARPGQRLGDAAAAQVRPAQRRRRRAVRRQPAEGRARQVAGHRARRAHRGRAHPGHRRRHQGRGAPAAVGAGRAGHRGADDLLRPAGGARHGRPGAGHARGAARPPRSRAPRPPRRASCPPRPGGPHDRPRDRPARPAGARAAPATSSTWCSGPAS